MMLEYDRCNTIYVPTKYWEEWKSEYKEESKENSNIRYMYLYNYISKEFKWFKVLLTGDVDYIDDHRGIDFRMKPWR